jgi:hypothetical protein
MNDFNIRQYEEYITYDEPIPYKDIYLYPVTIRDYMRFRTVVNCLIINKNRVPDPKIISMSYLDFIFHIANENEESLYYFYMLIEVIRICLRIKPENIKYVKDNNDKVNLILDEFICDRKDFDNIRKIICYQNAIDLPDEGIDPKLEKALQEMEEYRAKNKPKTCSFERQMLHVMRNTGMGLESVKQLSARKFHMILENIDKQMHYEILMTAKMSGMVEFKEEIDHWMTEIKIDKYKDMIGLDDFKNKLDGKK